MGPRQARGARGRVGPRVAALGLALALPLGAAVSVAAQEPDLDALVGRAVTDVTLWSEGEPVPQASVRELVQTRIGQPLSLRQVRESLTHLFALGRYEDVRLEAIVDGPGVELRYDLVPQVLVERIRLGGTLGVPEDDLREALAVTLGSAFEIEAVELAESTLRRYYRSRGFMRARIQAVVEGERASRTMRVTVEAGERARIGQITLSGVGITQRPVMLGRLGLSSGQPYDGVDVDRRLAALEDELREERYYETATRHEAMVDEEEGRVDLTVEIRRGPRITLVFEGDEVPDADLASLVGIEREASIDEDLLEDADRRIATHLRDLGYRDAVVSHRRETEGSELSLVFTVVRGPVYEIAAVSLTGNEAVADETLAPLVALQPGDPLVTARLNTALESVAEHYRRLGYATVLVAPVVQPVPVAADEDDGTVRVTCEIAITEGVLTRVRSVRLAGSDGGIDTTAVLTSVEGAPYDVNRVVADRDALRARYLDTGFERVVVTVVPEFDETLEAVDLVYQVREGPQITIEHVLIVGNDAIASDAIRREITLVEGAPLSLTDVAETRRRLNAMGLFRRVDIREFSHGGRGRRDVVVMVDEAPATRLGYGGGLEAAVRLRRQTTEEGSVAVEQLEFAPRGFFQIGRGNLWGKNRSIDLFTRVSLRRKNDPVDPEESAESSSLGFNEYRVLGTYQEPRVFDTEWDGFITGFVEQAIRPGFDLFSRGINAQVVRQLTPALIATVDYGWGQNNTTNKELNPEDEPLVDRLFPQVRLSAFSGRLLFDRRDDPADPRDGELYTVEAKVAARAIGSEVGFVKTYFGAFLYREIPWAPRFVFAGGARLGLASTFVRSVTLVPIPPPEPEDSVAPVGTPIEIEVGELPLSERFFAGGDTSVRGFALDRLGDEATIDQDGFPQGGNATVIFNLELRASMTRALDVVGFLDAGNVYDKVDNFSLARIRGGAGFGVRYRSPVGPIRVDLGFKLDRQRFGNGELERPTALHISIGQAF